MNRLASVVAIVALGLGTPVVAKEKKAPPPPPPQPAEQPDWAQVRSESEATVKANLFDPMSAQIEWHRGFAWGYYKPILSKKIWGWVGCGTVNAKNRMGGYVGATAFVIVYDGGVKYSEIGSGRYDLVGAACAQMGLPAPQAALLDWAEDQPAKSEVSVADELAKLAALKDKGVITEAEFQAQKTKLLAR